MWRYSLLFAFCLIGKSLSVPDNPHVKADNTASSVHHDGNDNENKETPQRIVNLDAQEYTVDRHGELRKEQKADMKKEQSINEIEKPVVPEAMPIVDREDPNVEKEEQVIEKQPVIVTETPIVMKKAEPFIEENAILNKLESIAEKEKPFEEDGKPLINIEEPDAQTKEPINKEGADIEEIELIREHQATQKEEPVIVEDELVPEKKELVREKKDGVLKKKEPVFEEEHIFEKEKGVIGNKLNVKREKLVEEEEYVKKEEPIIEKETTVREHDKPVVEKEASIVETGELILENDKPVVDKEESVVKTEESVVEMEEPAVYFEIQFPEKKEPVVKKEGAIVEKNEPFVEKERPLLENEEPVVDTEGPAVEKEIPAVEDERPLAEKEEPIFEKEKPILENEMPLHGKKAPVLENDKPVVKKESTIENEEPGVESEEPDVDTEPPFFDKRKPAVENEMPLVRKEEPVLEKDKPVIGKEGSTVENERSFVEENEELVVETEEPAVENERPCVEKEEHVFEKENPAIENEHTFIDKEQLVEEKEHPFEAKEHPGEEDEQPNEEQDHPVEEKEQPVEENKEPIEDKEQPIEAREQLGEEDEQPIEENEQPVEEKEQSIEKMEQRFEEDEQPFEEDEGPSLMEIVEIDVRGKNQFTETKEPVTEVVETLIEEDAPDLKKLDPIIDPIIEQTDSAVKEKDDLEVERLEVTEEIEKPSIDIIEPEKEEDKFVEETQKPIELSEEIDEPAIEIIKPVKEEEQFLKYTQNPIEPTEEIEKSAIEIIESNQEDDKFVEDTQKTVNFSEEIEEPVVEIVQPDKDQEMFGETLQKPVLGEVDPVIELQKPHSKSESHFGEPQAEQMVEPQQQAPPVVYVKEHEESTRPNIVILLADGVNEEDLGCYRGKTETPNINSIAANGVLLSHHIAGGLTDTSSRAALMTGRLAVRYGMAPAGEPDEIPTMASQSGLPPNETTFAKVLQNVGYTTGLIGKWNLGVSCDTIEDRCHHPNNHGFDYFFGFPLINQYTIPAETTGLQQKYLIVFVVSTILAVLLRHFLGNIAVLVLILSLMVPFGWSWFCFHNNHIWSSGLMRDAELVELPAEYEGASGRLVKEGVEFLQRVKGGDKPFLLIMSWHHIHSDIRASKAFTVPPIAERAAKVKELDWAVGEVTKSLEMLNLDSNTLIYFTSTGGQTHVAREGGQEVRHMAAPGLLQWTSKLPTFHIVDAPTSHVDIMPTLMRIAGGQLPADRAFDGRDILPELMGEQGAPRALFHYCGPMLHAVRYSTEEGRCYVGYLFPAEWQHQGGQSSPAYCSPASFSTFPITSEALTIFDLGKENLIHSQVLPTHRKYEDVQRDLKKAIHQHTREMVTAGEDQFTWTRQSWHVYLQPACPSGGYTCKDSDNSEV